MKYYTGDESGLIKCKKKKKLKNKNSATKKGIDFFFLLFL